MDTKKTFMKNKLAINGGNKVINNLIQHYKWPPKSKKKIKSVLDYLKNEKMNKYGFPEIVEKFEKKFKKKIGTKYALSTNSGTSALHASFFAINIQKGDEVIVPSLTFHATATPLLKFGAVPIFCDCDSDTGNISPEDIKKKITKKTKAILITHLCGHPCDMDKIIKLTNKRKIYLIEDCSHAHLSTYKNKKVGTFGDIGIFSMDRNKLLSVGEGGVLVTNNKIFFERALLTTDFGLRLENTLTLKSNKVFKETGFGFKHRIHPVAAAIAYAELDNLKKYIKLRHQKLNYLSKKLENIPGIRPPVTKKHVNRGAFYSYRLFYIKEELNNLSIIKFMKALKSEGLQVRFAGNRPLHLLPYFKKYGKKNNLKMSEKFYYSTISIPTFTFDSLRIVNLYYKAIKKVCNYYSR